MLKDGKPIPGDGGTLGWLKWLALHEPKVYASLLAVNRRPNLTPDRRPILTLLSDESGR
jgi:hypothetical protein